MSFEATTWAWKQKNVPYKSKLILLALSDWFNELESCAWPTYAQLADKTGMSRSSVQRGLNWLIEVGLVVVEPHFKNNRQQANRYRLPVNVIVFQGVQPDTHAVQIDTHAVQADLPIEDTVKDTVKDTVNSGKPGIQSDSKEKTNVKLDELDLKNSKSKETIFEKFKPTAKGCGDLWRDCRANASDENGFAGGMTQKQWKQLKDAHDKLEGIDFREVVWKVCADWTRFCKHAEAHFGAFKMGLNPTVQKFYQYRDAAADYTLQNMPVKLTAKPLTKQAASCTPIPKAKPATKYVNPYHPKPKKTPEEKAAIMQKLNEVDT